MAGEDIEDDVPVLMSGAGHDAMAMSHLTKVFSLLPRQYLSVNFSYNFNIIFLAFIEEFVGVLVRLGCCLSVAVGELAIPLKSMY